VQQNGLLSHPQDLDASLRLAAQRKAINGYRQQHADNQNISFLPAIVSHHGEFWRTEAHFAAAGMPSQRNQSDSVRFKCGILPVAEEQSRNRGRQAAALRINLNVEGCGTAAAPVCTLPLALPFFSLSFFHTVSLSPAFTSA